MKKKPKYDHSIIDFVNKWNQPQKKNTRAVSPLTKKIVASNQKWKCNQCGMILDYSYEVDHIIPLFKGGTNDVNNLVALCRNCHGRKTILEKMG